MRILFMGNNRVAVDVVDFLKSEKEDLVGLVLHPEDRRKCGREILAASGFSERKVIDGASLRTPETIQRIRDLRPDLIVSVLFDYILRPEIITLPSMGCINLHPAFLPYNRGQYPNVWSIVEGTPSGVTLHYIDERIDTGDIIARREVAVSPADTGQTLYRKLETACKELFIDAWPSVRKNEVVRIPQDSAEGTCHRTRDVEKIDCIDLDAKYTGRHLINILRARTFPPYRGAYFIEDGRRVYMQLKLEDEKDPT